MKKSLFISMLILCSSANFFTLHADACSDTIEQVSSNDAERLRELYGSFSLNASNLLAAIENLAQLASLYKVGNPALLNETLEWLLSTKEILSRSLQEPIITLTSPQIAALFRTVNLVSRALDAEINSNFSTLPILDYDTITQAKVASSTTLEQVEFYARETNFLVATVCQKSRSCGFSWFNQSYTSISDWMHRTGILRKGIQTLAVGTSAFLIYMLTAPDQWIPEGPLKKIREKINSLANNENMQKYVAFAGLGASLSTINTNLDLLSKIKNLAYSIDTKLRGVTPQTENRFEPTNSGGEKITLDSPLFDYMRKDLEPFYQICRYLQSPRSFAHIKMSHSFLVVGPSGSGKSFTVAAFIELCRQVAGGASVLIVDSTELFSSDGFRGILQRARENSPCVIFADELGIIGGGPQKKSNWAVLEDFLHGLDELDRDNDPQHKVFFIGATNCPHELSKALLRPGRINCMIELFEPNTEGRKTILSTLCKKSGINPDDVKVDLLSTITKGTSVSGLSKLIEEAVRRAKLNNTPVSFDDIYESLNDVIRRLHRQISLSPKERTVICTYLAGVATAYLLLETTEKLESITLRTPQKKIVEKYDWQATEASADEQEKIFQFKPNYGLYYTCSENEFFATSTSFDPFVQCKIKLAGKVAEKLLLGHETSYQKDAYQDAYNEAITALSFKMDLKTLSRTVREELQTTAWNKVKECKADIENLLSKHINAIHAIADALDKKDFLRIDEIEEVAKLKTKVATETPALTPQAVTCNL